MKSEMVVMIYGNINSNLASSPISSFISCFISGLPAFGMDRALN